MDNCEIKKCLVTDCKADLRVDSWTGGKYIVTTCSKDQTHYRVACDKYNNPIPLEWLHEPNE